ncbi:hypothetical protein [Niveispirillum sp. BGYR6]|uniref:hypothetical protein n=1 Tax=Niveispirillum sp. BGYR6 TaxID=2971249 RepID=UPI0022B99902|nr:hypothetical protein [Niveispirillum sp. BGYR6]MDG5493741.1 hypothetical protein [Niveispirillum sp. BGYR6]
MEKMVISRNKKLMDIKLNFKLNYRDISIHSFCIYKKYIFVITLISIGFSCVFVLPAHAFCLYHGVFSAKTTIAQEFADSKWVVRARVIAADYHWSDEDDSWTLYKLETVESFKGKLPAKFTFFTYRDSGGFYMDAEGGTPDLAGEYLLFLIPRPWPKTDPSAAKNALWVNYNCGQSKAWPKVTPEEVAQLRALRTQP